uniref:Erythroblast membrane associated protein (Scianna blood group) n=1 Tax=Sus scrofa TaxID=9823 RepID=A0A8D0WF96_PIG
MKMASSSGSWLSGCLVTLISLQLPSQASGDAGQSRLAPLGGTAELLCPLVLWPATVPVEVRWLRSSAPGHPQRVHLFREGKDLEEGVMPEYKGRTALLRDARDGSVTLEIRDVRLEDRGQYRCQVQIGNLSREGVVTLQVAVLGSEPYIHVQSYDAGWIQLVCKSAGWFPKPWAQWRDPQGKVFPSLWETHSLDEAGLFRTAVSNRVRDSTLGNVSCTIQNVALGQERTTAMVIAAPSPGSFSSSEVALAVILPLLGILIVLGIYFIWKQRRSRGNDVRGKGAQAENLLSDHAKEKGNCFPNLPFLCLSAVAVTLDPDTAHPKLILSGDRRCVKLGDTRQPVLDNPQRFDFVVSILGSEHFTAGCHYWEVSVADKSKWALGVCSESVNRKGKVTASPANGHWLLRQNRQGEYEALTSPPTSFRLKEPPRCVGVFLDYEAGVISFYNVTGRSHIFTFTHSFFGPLRPFFEPCLHDGGKNIAPLVICSELQKLEEPTAPKPEERGRANGDVALVVAPSLLPAQAPELGPLRDVVLAWPSDVTPALQGLSVPSF